jgi:hypothetical protein
MGMKLHFTFDAILPNTAPDCVPAGAAAGPWRRTSNDKADVPSAWVLSHELRPLHHEAVRDRVEQFA